YHGGETRDADQRQLTQLGNAAWAAGLSLLMDGRQGESREWLRRAAERYRDSWQDAPPGSWGRPIAAMKALLLVGDDASAAADWALEAGAADAESPIGRYAGALALLVLGEDDRRRPVRGADEAGGRGPRGLVCKRALGRVRLLLARNEEQHLAGIAQARQRQRDAADERLELRLGADRAPFPLLERRLVREERRDVPVGAE